MTLVISYQFVNIQSGQVCHSEIGDDSNARRGNKHYMQGDWIFIFLDLHLLKTMLPDGRKGCDTILTEVDQDVPGGR